MRYSTSLESKTIRPGGLGTYSFYSSDRRPTSRSTTKSKRARSSRRGHAIVGLLLLAATVAALVIGFKTGTSPSVSTPSASPAPLPAISASPAATAVQNQCAGNTADKFIKVSISQRHLWACSGAKIAYDAAVITGMQGHEETKTPPGTYRIYAKQAKTVLTGSDSAGSWRDPVDYWMPFLDNQFGAYGFHDATWRASSEFGNVDPNSDKASHGCVELQQAVSKWLYEWAPVGTAVTIEA